MGRKQSIKGVLHNFLGTFVSRYSCFDGYWLFGFLTGLLPIELDLLREVAKSVQETPLVLAEELAVVRFLDQLHKAGLSKSQLRDAHLQITRSANIVSGFVGGHACSGFEMQFIATASIAGGSVHTESASVFVASHNPLFESRNTRTPHTKWYFLKYLFHPSCQ